MAPSAIQQALNSLLPSRSKLPAPLVQLSESILAKSRQRASHLKPEEEIARVYACCELVCNRLRSQLRLPAVKTGGAPCKPTVYKKLLTYLERILEDDATTPKSTSKKRTAEGAFKESAVTEIATPTPTRKRGSDFVGKIKDSRNNSSATTDGKGDGRSPDYTMPLIRKLCKKFNTPLLAPHVYTGTCIVLNLAGIWPIGEGERQTDDEMVKENVTGILIALYLMTLTRMQTSKMTTKVYKSICQDGVDELEFELGTKGVEEWIRTINREGYCKGQEWWDSVPEAVFDFDPDGTAGLEYEDGTDDIGTGEGGRPKKRQNLPEEDDPEGVLLPGLATMMHDAIDYNCDERRQEFERWKEQFLRSLDKAVTPGKKGARAAGGKAIAAR